MQQQSQTIYELNRTVLTIYELNMKVQLYVIVVPNQKNERDVNICVVVLNEKKNDAKESDEGD